MTSHFFASLLRLRGLVVRQADLGRPASGLDPEIEIGG